MRLVNASPSVTGISTCPSRCCFSFRGTGIVLLFVFGYCCYRPAVSAVVVVVAVAVVVGHGRSIDRLLSFAPSRVHLIVSCFLVY